MLAALIAALGLGLPPFPTNADVWQNASDYAQPAGAILPLDVRIELTIDETGRPVHCALLDSNKPKGFDGAYCQIPMRRAHFRPARDEEGKPIVGVFSTDFHYRTSQGGHGPRWVDYSLTVDRLPQGRSPITMARVVTDPSGHVESCVLQTSGGIRALDDAACAYTLSAMSFTPPTDRGGQPARAMRLVSIGFAAGPATR